MGIFSLNQFCQRLAESGFVDPEAADARVDQWRDESSLSEDERKLADWLVERGVLTAFQAETLLIGLTPPYVLGDWKLVELTAAGRLGNVFRAMHKTSGASASLKVFPPGLRRDPLQLARMRREARVAVQMVHPHVVRTRSLGQHGEFAFLVLDALEGETLGDRLRRESRLSWLETARLGSEAAQGLHYLHTHKIIHRDVQPDNLWISRDGTVEVMEFGAARDALDYLESSDSGVGLSELGGATIVGTFDYMSPEQAQDMHSADARSDLYSLGCVLYRCLAGRPPFPDSHPVRQMLRHANEPPELIQSTDKTVPPALIAVISKLLSKKPGDRPAHAAQVADELERIAKSAHSAHAAKNGAPSAGRADMSALVAVCERIQSTAVLHLSTATALDPSPLPSILTALDDSLRGDKPSNLVLDLRNISLLTSSGISSLIHASQKAKEAGIGLKLAAVQPPVQNILAITQLTRLFDIAPSVEAALAASGSRGGDMERGIGGARV